MPVPESPEERRRRSKLAQARKRRLSATRRTVNNDPKETEAQKLLDWRTNMFKQLGFTKIQAHKLADSDADWHDAKRMLEEGCSIKTAMKILQP